MEITSPVTVSVAAIAGRPIAMNADEEAILVRISTFLRARQARRSGSTECRQRSNRLPDVRDLLQIAHIARTISLGGVYLLICAGTVEFMTPARPSDADLLLANRCLPS
jgi:hypothetical protein